MSTQAIFCVLLAVSYGAAGADKLPSSVLDLQYWRLTLPYSGEGKEPLEVDQPALADFQDPECFFVNDKGDGVVFRAHCTDVSTRNSDYPRCELREMAAAPTAKRMAWNTTDETVHTMVVVEAITAVPPVKQHVVSAQIHAEDDDLLMVRLEEDELFLERNNLDEVALENDYVLGTPFEIKFEACKGHVKVWYNGELRLDWEVDSEGCYFKAGCYTQSNPDKGDKPESYGEVVLYKLTVSHGQTPAMKPRGGN